MPVQIHGKEYLTVAERVHTFRESHPDWAIQTELVDSGDAVIMKAAICNESGMLLATGYAEEVRGSTQINKTSALENCETSAVGRALAAMGYGGTEYASADEVATAISNQNEKAIYAKAQAHMQAFLDNFESVMAVKGGIMDSQPVETVKGQFEFGDEAQLTEAIEAFRELDRETKEALWLAPTKGGCFTTLERAVMKSDRWAAIARSA